jgi:hypothetical protein
MTAALEGGCACGSIRYRLTDEPMFTHYCHCLNCQNRRAVPSSSTASPDVHIFTESKLPWAGLLRTVPAVEIY